MIAIGFGRIEASERDAIKEALRDAAARGISEDEAVRPWNEGADKYDAMPSESAPERYTRVYLHDDKIVFLHIHRRHPFSPDGWAALLIEEKR